MNIVPRLRAKKGERFVEAEVYKVNGLEVGRVIQSEEILDEPTTKVVYRGTKDPPPKKGTGVFAKPTSRGYITSGFGWRWGRQHTGIDIGVAIGTPVTAADGGEVIFSGTKGGYGKCIIIDHGANMKTLYAHNSKLYVRKGDKVFKGQTIAASGNTGRSTGTTSSLRDSEEWCTCESDRIYILLDFVQGPMTGAKHSESI